MRGEKPKIKWATCSNSESFYELITWELRHRAGYEFGFECSDVDHSTRSNDEFQG